MTVEELRKSYALETGRDSDSPNMFRPGYVEWLEHELCRENDIKLMVSKILEYMKPCPECEKHKRAVAKLIGIIVLDRVCLHTDEECPHDKDEQYNCSECWIKWAYEEGRDE